MRQVDLDPETERAARAFLARIAGTYELAGAILFGSRARGNHKPDSDADIAVLLHGRRGRFLDTKLAMADLPTTCCWKRVYASSRCPSGKTSGNIRKITGSPGLLQNISREGVRL